MWKMPINPQFYVSYSISYRSLIWSIISVDWLTTVLGLGFLNFTWRKIYDIGALVVQSLFFHSTISVCCKHAADPNVQWPNLQVGRNHWVFVMKGLSFSVGDNEHKTDAKFISVGKNFIWFNHSVVGCNKTTISSFLLPTWMFKIQISG